MPRRPPSVPWLVGALFLEAASAPQTADAQLPVTDGANLAARTLEYAMQALQLAEEVEMVVSLTRQIEQLDDQIQHLRDAANGRVAALSQAFSQLSSDPASLLRDGGAGWAGGLAGDGPALARAIANMDGSSLVDHLRSELDAADAIGEADLLNLYPGSPERGTRLAEAWREGREDGDRIRAADFTAAEAGGRLAALLATAQDDIAGIRAQGELSHTALQQAMVANQLTAAEIDIAVAQLLAVQAQQDALLRQQAELLERRRLQQWVQREQAAQTRLQTYLDAEEARRAAYRNAFRLTPPQG